MCGRKRAMNHHLAQAKSAQRGKRRANMAKNGKDPPSSCRSYRPKCFLSLCHTLSTFSTFHYIPTHSQLKMFNFMAPARWICWIDLEELKKTVEALRLSDELAILRAEAQENSTSPR